MRHVFKKIVLGYRQGNQVEIFEKSHSNHQVITRTSCKHLGRFTCGSRKTPQRLLSTRRLILLLWPLYFFLSFRLNQVSDCEQFWTRVYLVNESGIVFCFSNKTQLTINPEVNWVLGHGFHWLFLLQCRSCYCVTVLLLSICQSNLGQNQLSKVSTLHSGKKSNA